MKLAPMLVDQPCGKFGSGGNVASLLGALLLGLVLGYLLGEGVNIRAHISTDGRCAQAYSEMRTIEVAVRNFHAALGRWPIHSSGESNNVYSGAAQRMVIRMLTGDDPSINTNRHQYLLLPKTAHDGLFLDPWGHAYGIAFAPTQGLIVPELGLVARSGLLVWSAGPGKLKLWEHEGPVADPQRLTDQQHEEASPEQ